MPDIVEDAVDGSERAAVPSRLAAERLQELLEENTRAVLGRKEAEAALEEVRVRAYRETRIWEPNMDTHRAAVAVYEAAFGPRPQAARQDDKDDSETLRELPPEVMDAFDVIARAILAIRRRAEIAEAKLATYGRHLPQCAARSGYRDPCTCGLAEAVGHGG